MKTECRRELVLEGLPQINIKIKSTYGVCYAEICGVELEDDGSVTLILDDDRLREMLNT